MKHRHFIAGLVLAAGALAGGAALAQGMMSGPMGGPMGGPGMDRRPSFEELDADKDGTVTQDEMLAHAKGRFDAVDTDGNGQITLEEMQAQARQRADAMAAQMLKRMDQNGDGVLSFDEMPGQRRESRMERMFSRFDADGDGSVSQDEFDTARQRMGSYMGKMGHMGRHGGIYGNGMMRCDGPMQGQMRGQMQGQMPGQMQGQMGGMGPMGDCDGSGPGRQRMMQGDN